MDVAIVGCQNGDEGKGKFSDVFAAGAAAVVRYQGGPHTGHTVETGFGRLKFVQTPVGIARGMRCAVGNGCVIDPIALRDEIVAFRRRGLTVDLTISSTAHVVFPYHRMMDVALETWRGPQLATSVATGIAQGGGQLGSTRRGVGPCREDKIARIGLRLVDLLDRALLGDRLSRLIALKRRVISAIAPDLPLEPEEDWQANQVAARYYEAACDLQNHFGDVSAFVRRIQASGRPILYEGAQSIGLDIEFGTYPYCSSGHSVASGVGIGVGRPPGLPLRVLGVLKAYTTTVGGGPLPTELEGPAVDQIAERGHEYGTVTGRRRRIGWLDLCFVRKAIRVDGIEGLCISCMDVLGGLGETRICTHYEVGTRTIDEYPASMSELPSMRPIYKTLPGWGEIDRAACAHGGAPALPPAARTFINLIEAELRVPVVAIGIGAAREHTIIRSDPFVDVMRPSFLDDTLSETMNRSVMTVEPNRRAPS